MLQRFRRIHSQKGAGLVEYGMLVGLLSVLAIGAVFSVGSSVKTIFCETTNVVAFHALGTPQTDCFDVADGGQGGNGGGGQGGNGNGGGGGGGGQGGGGSPPPAPTSTVFGPGGGLYHVTSTNGYVAVLSGQEAAPRVVDSLCQFLLPGSSEALAFEWIPIATIPAGFHTSHDFIVTTDSIFADPLQWIAFNNVNMTPGPSLVVLRSIECL